MGCVYMATNNINGKQYIGKTIKRLSQRKTHHLCLNGKCGAFYQAIKKYGRDAFSWKTLFQSDDNDALLREEARLIKEHNTIAPSGYNLMSGGREAKATLSTRIKLREAGKRYWSNLSPEKKEQRKKMTEAVRKMWRDPAYRKRMQKINERINASEKRKKKISASMHLKYAMDPDYRKRRAEASRAKCKTPEWIQNNKIASSGRRKRGLCTCIICGKVFDHPYDKKTCSSACLAEAWRRNSIRRWEFVEKKRRAG